MRASFESIGIVIIIVIIIICNCDSLLSRRRTSRWATSRCLASQSREGGPGSILGVLMLSIGMIFFGEPLRRFEGVQEAPEEGSMGVEA